MAKAVGARAHGLDGFEPRAFGLDASGLDASVLGATEDEARASILAMAAFYDEGARQHGGAWRDIAVHHRRTEVDVQVLPVVMEGGAYGVDTPMCRKLVRMVHEIEEGAREQSDDNLVELLGP